MTLPVHVVSLKRSLERRSLMATQLVELGLDWQFFDAIDGAIGDLDFDRYDEPRRLRSAGMPLRPGELGCFASHYKLWTRSVATQRSIVILEDDVQVAPAMPAVIDRLEPVLDRLGVVRLGWIRDRAFWRIAPLDAGHDIVKHWDGPRGTQCYAIAPWAAQRLINGARRWWQPVDIFLDDEAQHGLPVHAVAPLLARHRLEEMGSTIEPLTEQRLSIGAKLRREASRLSMQASNRLFNLRYRLAFKRDSLRGRAAILEP